MAQCVLNKQYHFPLINKFIKEQEVISDCQTIEAQMIDCSQYMSLKQTLSDSPSLLEEKRNTIENILTPIFRVNNQHDLHFILEYIYSRTPLEVPNEKISHSSLLLEKVRRLFGDIDVSIRCNPEDGVEEFLFPLEKGLNISAFLLQLVGTADVQRYDEKSQFYLRFITALIFEKVHTTIYSNHTSCDFFDLLMKQLRMDRKDMHTLLSMGYSLAIEKPNMCFEDFPLD